MKATSKQSGISLIEVLVVLVLLLVGIFSVVRLFPPGFLVNKQNEARTIASRLAQQEINRFTNNATILMDAIVPLVPDQVGSTIVWRVDLHATPDDLTDVKTPILGIDPYYFSNVNKPRRIHRESVRIPIPSPTFAGLGSVYVLSSGPIYNIPFANQYGQTVASIVVSGAPMFRRVQDTADPDSPSLFGPSQYAIDYDAGQVAFFPAPFPRQFVATYNYYDTNFQVQTALSEIITVPANAVGWRPLAANRPVVPESDVVARGFVEKGLADAWTEDPYEYKLLSQNVGAFANVGVLLFNPRGRDYTEFTPNGSVPLTAHIDYTVLDWRIIREDRPMPASEPYIVRLSLKGLKRLNDFEPDQTRYIGLFRDPSIPAQDRRDLMVVDLTSGQVVNPGNYSVDYREGTVTFAPAFGQANATGTFRFFYKARGEWALQIQKACSSYRRHVAAAQGDDANVGLCEYYLGGGVNGGSSTRIYFPLIDAGKSVAIREFWYRDANNNSIRVANETFRINSNRALFETFTVNNAPRTLTWIDIKEKYSDAVAWDAIPAGQPVVGVQGVSFKARVLWTDGSTIEQTPNGQEARTRWKRVDLDTFLTRSQN